MTAVCVWGLGMTVVCVWELWLLFDTCEKGVTVVTVLLYKRELHPVALTFSHKPKKHSQLWRAGA